MATITFSDLPAEIHINIAEQCENTDLINLFLTSKLVHERCLRVLYRHVDLQFNAGGLTHWIDHQSLSSLLKKQIGLVRTLRSHIKYGKFVRSLKGTLYLPACLSSQAGREDVTAQQDLLAAMQSLTHVQSVDLAFKNTSYGMVPPMKQFPNTWFQSATSVRLVGRMQYGLAKSILNAVNPALLRHLCLDLVRERLTRQRQGRIMPGDMGEDGRIVARGVMSGLLTPLTDRCTVLRTLDLRRMVVSHFQHHRHQSADQASYMEWACFIRSVQGTVEEFTFEQVTRHLELYDPEDEIRALRTIMDEKFERLILPAIVSANWPRLKRLELRGVGGSYDQGGKVALTQGLTAALGEEAIVVVEEKAHALEDS